MTSWSRRSWTFGSLAALLVILVACSTPLLVDVSERIDSITPALGAPGTVVEDRGLFDKHSVVEICGFPLESWVLADPVDAVLAAPGVGGDGPAHARGTGVIPDDVPPGTRCDVGFAGRSAGSNSTAVEFTTIGLVAVDDGPLFLIDGGGSQELVIADLLANDTPSQSAWGFERVVSTDGVDVTVGATTLSVLPTVPAGEIATLVYEISDETLETSQATVTFLIVLPPASAIIFDDVAEFEDFVESPYSIPTFAEVFNSWPRGDGVDDYENVGALPVEYDGPADDWVLVNDDWDGDLEPDERILMPLNVQANQVVVSPADDVHAFYTFEATLFSADDDNDSIGLVIAFLRDDVAGVNRYLVAHRTMDGDPPDLGWGVTLQEDVDVDDSVVLAEKSVGGIPDTFDGDQWGGLTLSDEGPYGVKGEGLTSRIRIERVGDLIRAYAGVWDEADVDPASLIELDLAANTVNGEAAPEGVDLTIFRGPKQYGCFTYSQRGSTYLDVVFEGGAALDTAILLTGGTDTDGDGEDDQWTGSEVWRFDDVDGWQRDLGATIQIELGTPLVATSTAEPLDGTSYTDGYSVTGRAFLVRDGEVVRVDD